MEELKQEKGVKTITQATEEDELYQALYKRIINKSCSTNPIIDRISVQAFRLPKPSPCFFGTRHIPDRWPDVGLSSSVYVATLDATQKRHQAKSILERVQEGASGRR